jgi:hypothetical protein
MRLLCLVFGHQTRTLSTWETVAKQFGLAEARAVRPVQWDLFSLDAIPYCLAASINLGRTLDEVGTLETLTELARVKRA